MTERISLKGNVAVVTGAGRGLGRGYVELPAERDARVVVNDLGTEVSGRGKDSAIAEQVANAIRSRGGEAIANSSDVSFDRHWRVHVGGSVNTVKAAWPHMVAQHYGKIILTTSVAGLFGIRGQATYAAAKAGVVGLMRVLAIEGAEHRILVNTISPAACTRMHPAAGAIQRIAIVMGPGTIEDCRADCFPLGGRYTTGALRTPNSVDRGETI